MFDELEIKGLATLTDATFSQITARLYDGTAVGKATVSWHKGLQLKGNAPTAKVKIVLVGLYGKVIGTVTRTVKTGQFVRVMKVGAGVRTVRVSPVKIKV